jgi:hypothetical protein
MTLIAGIFARKPNVPIPVSVCEQLRRSLSRNEADSAATFGDERGFFVKLDIGAFDETAGIVGANGAVTLIAGEPLLGECGRQSRQQDTERIHSRIGGRDSSVLRDANGVFCGIHYEPLSGELLLMTDKLGIRPLYYYISRESVIFAGALRILEALIEVPKTMDVRAVTEMVGLGFALGDRTPYVDIKLLRAGEILRISEKTIEREPYWRWNEIEMIDRPDDEILSDLYSAFNAAVIRRTGNETTTAAYLSGGLDSRCIVAALRERDVKIETFNFARPDTQDQIFGREFAAAIGARHHELPKQPGDVVPDYSTLMSDARTAQNREAERPNIVWSGEGGSVALGHVHMSEQIVAWMRAGKIDAAIDEYLRREFAQVSPRIFKNGFGPRLSRITNEGIRKEIARFKCTDAARNFYFFLLLNDQHRKLAKHFENIDIHRLEFQLPFFDSAFLERIASIPIDACLRHKLYVQWLSFFPKAVSSVPWQTYPGHEPCPIAMPDGLDYQWSKQYQTAERAARRKLVLAQAKELFNGGRFPAKLLDRRSLRLAAWAHDTGLRDYAYLIGPAHTFYSYAEKCEGRYELGL